MTGRGRRPAMQRYSRFGAEPPEILSGGSGYRPRNQPWTEDLIRRNPERVVHPAVTPARECGPSGRLRRAGCAGTGCRPDSGAGGPPPWKADEIDRTQIGTNRIGTNRIGTGPGSARAPVRHGPRFGAGPVRRGPGSARASDRPGPGSARGSAGRTRPGADTRAAPGPGDGPPLTMASACRRPPAHAPGAAAANVLALVRGHEVLRTAISNLCRGAGHRFSFSRRHGCVAALRKLLPGVVDAPGWPSGAAVIRRNTRLDARTTRSGQKPLSGSTP
ncbi:hypothetical protein FraQA3DRAFT_4624 [Frankia sp. QA3]|nr:hypothetical protein FraQA3DRAFT_4624 [Frankia sp. QA3]